MDILQIKSWIASAKTESLDDLCDAIKVRRDEINDQAAHKLAPGNQVEFDWKGRKLTGTLTRVRRRVDITGVNGQLYTFPASMVTKLPV